MNEFEKKVLDSSLWPWFERGDHLTELHELANDVCERNSLEGYLAAALIYHQLSEEIVKLLLDYNDFYVKAKIYPIQIKSLRKLERKMFGGLVEELASTVEFDYKSGMIQILGTLNSHRITLVHKLTAASSLSEVRDKVSEISHLYGRLFQYFDLAIDWYRERLNELHDENLWKKLKATNKATNNAPAAPDAAKPRRL